MNHLEKKCCDKCRMEGCNDPSCCWDGCKNEECPCHTPTPYSVLREKVMAATRLDMPAIEYIMLHIDEYRENLAKEVWHAQRKHVHTAGPAIPDNCNDCVFNNGIHTAKRIIRRT